MNAPGGNGKQSRLGVWWLPGQEGDKRTGVLDRRETGAFVLRLVGRLGEKSPAPPDYWRVPMIHGEINAGEVTLLDCHENYEIPSDEGGVSLQVVRGDRALFGVLLGYPDEPCVTSATFQIENARPFFYPGQEGVHIELSPAGGFSSEDDLGWSADGRKLRVQEFTVGEDDDAITYCVRARQKSFGTSETQLSLDTTAETAVKIRVSSAVPRPLADYDRYGRDLMDLLTLASGRPSGMSSYELTWTSEALSADWARILADGAPDRHPSDRPTQPPPVDRPAHVENASIHVADTNAKPVAESAFLFTCADVPFQQFGPSWIDLSNTARRAIKIMLAQIYTPDGYLETKTMEAAAAVESMQRALLEGTPGSVLMPPRCYEDAMSRIEGVLDEEQWALIQGQIHNEGTFSCRVDALLREPDQDAVAMIVPAEELPDYIRHLVARRNHHAHGLSDAKGLKRPGTPAQEHLNMRYLIARTTLILRLVVADRLGVSKARQQKFAGSQPHLDIMASDMARAIREAQATVQAISKMANAPSQTRLSHDADTDQTADVTVDGAPSTST